MLRQANELWPNRSRISDGTIGDPAHSARTSDHNPDGAGWVRAVDLTHDPANGCDAHAWARQVAARRDPRVKYLISNGQIWNPSISPEWRTYTGANAHTRHAHLSIKSTDAALHDTAPWFQNEEEDVALTAEERKLLELALQNAIDAKNYGVACLAALNELDATTTVDLDAEAVARRVDELLAQRLAS